MGQIFGDFTSVAIAGRGSTLNLILLMLVGTLCYLAIRRFGR